MDKLKLEKLKDLYGAIANKNRLNIIFLCQKEGLTVTELSKKLKLNYTITSQYVGILAKAGLVEKTRNADKTVTVKSLVKINESGEITKIRI